MAYDGSHRIFRYNFNFSEKRQRQHSVWAKSFIFCIFYANTEDTFTNNDVFLYNLFPLLFSVGILGFLLHQIIDLISEVKWEQTKEYIAAGEFSTALMWTFCYSLVFLIVSTLLVVYQPAAAGSGIPEIIGFLNGTRIPDIFKVNGVQGEYILECTKNRKLAQ